MKKTSAETEVFYELRDTTPESKNEEDNRILTHGRISRKQEMLMKAITYIQLSRSEETDWLQENDPNSFLLLCYIARRARRTLDSWDGREIGEAEIGDFKKAGLRTQDEYREAKKRLVKYGHILVVETKKSPRPNPDRHPPNAPTKTPTKRRVNGTLVKLISSRIWNINPETEKTETPTKIPTKPRPTMTQHTDEQEERSKNEKKDRVVCIPSEDAQAREEKKEIPSRIKKMTMTGREIEISLENDIFTKAILMKKNWNADEIRESWKILYEFDGAIRDPMAFFEGTVNNIRNKKRSEFLNNGEKRCQEDQIMKYSECKEKSLEKDMKEQPCLGSLLKGVTMEIIQ